MRIGIDARIAHYTGGGISQYTIHLAKALAQLSQDDEFVLLQSRKDRRHLMHGPHVRRVSIWTPSHNRFEQELLQVEIPAAPSGPRSVAQHRFHSPAAPQHFQVDHYRPRPGLPALAAFFDRGQRALLRPGRSGGRARRPHHRRVAEHARRPDRHDRRAARENHRGLRGGRSCLPPHSQGRSAGVVQGQAPAARGVHPLRQHHRAAEEHHHAAARLRHPARPLPRHDRAGAGRRRRLAERADLRRGGATGVEPNT